MVAWRKGGLKDGYRNRLLARKDFKVEIYIPPLHL
jgi:hypothetical protein